MGVLDPGLICPTDGLDYMQTPGYFGHIELAKPVFYIQYLTTVIKIMRCVCIKCSNLLINKDDYKQVLNMPNEARWNYVFKLASHPSVKKCGDFTIVMDVVANNLKDIKKKTLSTVYAEWENADGSK